MISKIKELVLICCALLLMLPACIPEPTMYVASNGTRYIDLSGTYIASTGGSGSANSTIHGGIIGRMAVFDNTTSITSATNTDAQVSSAVTLKHTQGTDTTLGVQVAPINMGIHKIVSLAAPSDNTDAATVKYVIDNAGTGPAGPVGPAGPAGANGLNGTNGTNGATGPAGPNYISSNTTTSFIGFLYGLSGNVTTRAENLTGRGTSAYLTKWSGASTIVSATNTDSDVSDAVTKKHTQGTDTTLGTQTADLNMGTKAIINVGNVDGVDVSSHASRHQFNSSDTVNIKDLLAVNPMLLSASTGDAYSYTTTLTGGRGVTGLDWRGIGAYTANPCIANDTTGLAAWGTQAFHYGIPGLRWRTSFRLFVFGNTDHSEYWFGWLPSSSSFPVSTQSHIGFQVIGPNSGIGDGHASLYASNCDGTTTTQTLLSNTMANGYYADVGIRYMADSIQYWCGINGAIPTLVATVTTSRPTTWTGLYYGVWVKSYDTVYKGARLDCPVLMQTGE